MPTAYGLVSLLKRSRTPRVKEENGSAWVAFSECLFIMCCRRSSVALPLFSCVCVIIHIRRRSVSVTFTRWRRLTRVLDEL